LREAHRRGLRVITELVINHTSDQHEMVSEIRRAKPGSKWRDYYVWSDTQEKYKEARIIFKDFEPSNWTWDPVARAFSGTDFMRTSRFELRQPEVHQEIIKVFDFWLDLAWTACAWTRSRIYIEREAPIVRIWPETHEFLKKLRSHMDPSMATGCCWRRRITGRRMPWPTLARGRGG